MAVPPPRYVARLAISSITDGLFLPEGQSYLRTLGSLPVVLESESRCWTQLLYESTKLNYWSNLLTCCQRFLCDLKRDLCWVTSQRL